MNKSQVIKVGKRLVSTSTASTSENHGIRNAVNPSVDLINNKIVDKNDSKKALKKEDKYEELRLLDQSIRNVEYLSKNFKDLSKFDKLPKNYALNQNISVNNELTKILWKFDAPIRYAFAYGSGVFTQGYLNPDTQTDLIFGVTYPDHWHSINMKYNPDHYSTLRYFGSDVVSKVQEIGAGVYFNPFVEIEGKLVKYGVVSVDTLIKDLAQWNSFYLAGRLQKPVSILRDDPIIKFWNQQNLRAAATLAYLDMNLKPNEAFDEFKFYENITALSYKGDIRYKLGAENPNKINKIVSNNFEYFQQYYSPILNEIIKENHFVFPPGFTKDNYNEKLKDTIFRSSALQTLKGIFTAGVSKSVKYALAKKSKATSS